MKIKTHSGTKKRVKVRGKGKNLKLTFDKAAKRHLMVNKSSKQKGIVSTIVKSADRKSIRTLLQK